MSRPSRRQQLAAREAWQLMSALVLDHERRRQVAELGLSFGRMKALRRIARRPLAMGALAAQLGIDAPYTTVVVDDLEARGLVERRPHPTDRRAKVVAATPEGAALAARAEDILGRPPAGLEALPPAGLEALVRTLRTLQSDHPAGR